ncbi:hypothetical protein O9992_01220 [Vibrio lentus]|nr:hypothetical protein [Vibrio lentus]
MKSGLLQVEINKGHNLTSLMLSRKDLNIHSASSIRTVESYIRTWKLVQVESKTLIRFMSTKSQQ